MTMTVATVALVVGGAAVVGGGLAAGTSVMKSNAENDKLMQQQAGLQINQNNTIANLLSSNLNIKEGMGDTKRATAQALTNTEKDYLNKSAKHIAVRATRNTAGLSALASYTHLQNQKMMTKGNVISAGESELIRMAKAAQEGAREGQGRMNEFQGQLNMAQANKKSSTDMAIEAAMKGIGGAMKGASMGASALSAFKKD